MAKAAGASAWALLLSVVLETPMISTLETAPPTPSVPDPNKAFLDAISPDILANTAEIESALDEHGEWLYEHLYGSYLRYRSAPERDTFTADVHLANLIVRPVVALAAWLQNLGSPHPLAPRSGASGRVALKALLGFVDASHPTRPFVWHMGHHLIGSEEPLMAVDHWLATLLAPERNCDFGWTDFTPKTADRARLLFPRVIAHLLNGSPAQRADAAHCLSENLTWWKGEPEVSTLLPVTLEVVFSARERWNHKSILSLPGACAEVLGQDELLVHLLAFCERVDRGELGDDQHHIGSGWALSIKWSSKVCQPVAVRLLSMLSGHDGSSDATNDLVAQLAEACSRSATLAEAVGSVLFDEQLAETLLNQCGPRIRALFCRCPHLLHWCLDQVLKLPENDIRRSNMEDRPWFKALAAWLKGQSALVEAVRAHPVPAAQLLMLSLIQAPETDSVISEVVAGGALVESDSAWVGFAAKQPHGARSIEALLDWFALVGQIRDLARCDQLRATIARAPRDRRAAWVQTVLARHFDGNPNSALYCIRTALKGLDEVIPLLASRGDRLLFGHMPLIGSPKARKEATACLKRLTAASILPEIPHHASVEWLSDWCSLGLIDDRAMVESLTDRLFSNCERTSRIDDGNQPHDLSTQAATRLLDWFASNCEAALNDFHQLKFFALCSAIAIRGDNYSIERLIEVAGPVLEHAGHARWVLDEAIQVFVGNIPAECLGPITFRLSMALPAKAVAFLKQREHNYGPFAGLRQAMLFEHNAWPRPEPLQVAPLYRAVAALGQTQSGSGIFSEGVEPPLAAAAQGADSAALAEDLGARLRSFDEQAIASASAALDALTGRARLEIMDNLKVALDKAGLGDAPLARISTELDRDYPNRSRLERALKAAEVPTASIGKILDRAADERLPAMLARALSVCVGLPIEHWQEDDEEEGVGDIRSPRADRARSVAGLVVDRLCAVYADQPTTLARVVVKLLEGWPMHNPDAIPSLRGLMYALGKLREPVGGASPKALLRIAEDESLSAPLRKTAAIQKALFERDALNRGRHRKAEGRMADALASIRQGCVYSAASLLGDRFERKDDPKPLPNTDTLS